MNSRLAILCEKILESGWLAALIVAPLYFDVYSSRVFEPDKIALVRSLALAMIGAWIVQRIEIGFPRADAWRDYLRANPLLFPTLVIVAVYLFTTITSLVPQISFWGSYQRLEGTYTTFAYIAIFLIAISALRTRAQLERALNVILVTSFPIAFYGIIQHFQLDPLPWGGDTVLRVASNMGNSIFVAAYLIMIVPLTLARWLAPHSPNDNRAETRARILFFCALVILAALWVYDFTLGTLFALALYLLAIIFARVTRSSVRAAIWRATHTLILAAQLVAIFFTQSRGPWVGLAAGLFAFAILYPLARGARRIALAAISFALVGVVVLLIFNLPNSPLDQLKRVPYIGRLGQIFETESGTGKVRELIWQGALQAIAPHAPLWSPTTGDDALNLIRPLIGYGPEAMYVAFNPFYPPELAHLEARNASPDRSHNETFDALVMTGLVGFAANILLFISVFYFGLKWLGIIETRAQRNAFIALWFAGGFVSALIFGLTRGWNFIGVALPTGMIAGFFVFLIARAIFSRPGENANEVNGRALWLCALIAALLAHFIEIHFGIAIVSTREYFWFYAALLVVIGLDRLRAAARPPTLAPQVATARSVTRRRKQRNAQPRAQFQKDNDAPALSEILMWTAIAVIILLTLIFEFFNNQTGTENVLEAVRQSLFLKLNGDASAVFLLFALTWLVMGVIGLDEFMARGARAFTLILFVALTFTAMVWFALLQERALTQAGDLTNAFVGLVTQYYLGLILLVVIVAVTLYLRASRNGLVFMRAAPNALIAPVGVVSLALIIYATNFANVTADIFYKSGVNYDNLGAWDQSIAAYRRARDLQPAQDFYALFLGRAYLEKARTLSDPAQRASFLKLSEQTLVDAENLNPLNTDHAANLARLHRIWAGIVDDANERSAHFQKSSEYYQIATRLSPFTAYLRNEWSQTYYQNGDLDHMRAVLEQSVQIDDGFAQTFFLLGEYFRAQNDALNAAENYFKVLALDPNALADADGTPFTGAIAILAQKEIAPRAQETLRAASVTFPNALAPYYARAEIYKRNDQRDLAQQMLEQAVKVAPTDYAPQLQLVNFFSERGQIDAAVSAMRRVLDLLPSTRNADYARFTQFYSQLQTLQRAIQTAQRAPNDIAAHRAVATLWKGRGQPQFALPEYQIVLNLAPFDYDAQKNIALINLQLLQTDDAQRALIAAAAIAPAAEKPFWQNLQMALNDYKAQRYDSALKFAQAALALATEADKNAVNAYVNKIQELFSTSKK